MASTQAATQTAIIDILQETVQDWDLDQDEVTEGTQLVADLGFTSVDIIHLVVAIEEHFSQKLGFNQLLMNDGRYVDDLSVAQIAAFVAQQV